MVARDVVVPYNSVAVGTFGKNPHDVDGLRVAVRGQGAEVAQPEENRRVELRRTWGPAPQRRFVELATGDFGCVLGRCTQGGRRL